MTYSCAKLPGMPLIIIIIVLILVFGGGGYYMGPGVGYYGGGGIRLCLDLWQVAVSPASPRSEPRRQLCVRVADHTSM
jgi:hypothetical protein